MDHLKDENRQLKQSKTLYSKEADELRRDLDKTERKMETLAQFKIDYNALQEENSTLQRESQLMQEQFESIILEKDELEHQTEDAVHALHEEREIRSLLEIKVKEDSMISPPHPSWAAEEEERGVGESEEIKKPSLVQSEIVSSPAPLSRNLDSKFHSTPYANRDLQSELQDSFTSDANRDELQNLRKKLLEAQEDMNSLKKEKKTLEDDAKASLARELERSEELESFKARYTKDVGERDIIAEELNQRIIIRDEQIEQLRNKLSTVSGDKTSMEIEVDGLNNEIQRLKVVAGLEMDKIQREHAQEQTKGIQLKSHLSVLEEQVDEYTCAIEKLEGIILNSQNELSSMSDDIKSLQKVIVMLGTNGKFSPAKSSGQVLSCASDPNSEGNTAPSEAEENSESDKLYYSLDLKQKKSSVLVHSENHSLRAIVNLREQLKLVRAPMEKFTKVMLERSLVHSSKYFGGSPTPPSPDDHNATRKHTLDLEASISKWKSKFMHKTEEISNLRSIMKARATTADVATSSLRSKLEGQARAYQTELTKLRYQIKMLKKERDEHLSLRTMYAKRCEEYIDEITTARKTAEKRKQAYDELMVSLQKTIQRKLELSYELEEYKVYQEVNVVIPSKLESSRV